MHLRLSSLLLIVVVVVASVFALDLPSAYAITAKQGDLLGTTIYLRNLASDVAGYLSFRLTAPTTTANATFPITASSAGNLLVAKFISPAAFITHNIDLPSLYNFVFCMYGNKSSTNVNNASFFAEIGYYRGGVEYPFFNSTRSDKLANESMVGMLWQTRTSFNYTILQNDRLYFKVFLNALGSGRWYFGCDGRYVPSYFVDPNVTRWFRNDPLTNTTTPTSYSLTTGTYFSGTVTNIATSDNVYLVFNSTYSLVGNVSTVEAVFTGTVGTDFHLPMIDIQTEVHTNISVTEYLWGYNYTAGAYSTTSPMFNYGTMSTSDYSYPIYEQFRSDFFTSTSGREWKVKVKWNVTLSSFSVFIDSMILYSKWYYLSKVSNTGSGGGFDEDVQADNVGVRITKINQTWSGASLQAETNTRIDGGSVVATVAAPSSDQQLNGTYSMSQQSFQNLTVIVVYVCNTGSTLYTVGNPYNTASGKISIWQTEPLNDTELLDASTWTFCYYFDYFGRPIRETYLVFGDSTDNMRLVGFSTSPSAVTKAWYTIVTWEVDLVTRQWVLIVTWQENLTTRAWTAITWYFNLTTRAWYTSASWYFDLLTRAWHDIDWQVFLMTRNWTTATTFVFDLVTRTWQDVSTFWFTLASLQWHDVAAWAFDLVTRSWTDVASWNLFLLTRAWQDVSSWDVTLITRAWQNIATFTFDLFTLGWHDIAIWSIFLVSGIEGRSWLFLATVMAGFVFACASVPFLIRRRQENGAEDDDEDNA